MRNAYNFYKRHHKNKTIENYAIFVLILLTLPVPFQTPLLFTDYRNLSQHSMFVFAFIIRFNNDKQKKNNLPQLL